MNRMKKKIITIAAIGSFVLLTAGYSIFSTEKNQVNSLMLENIEALACQALDTDLNGNGTWCNCSDFNIFCEKHAITQKDIMGKKEERHYTSTNTSPFE